jgi:EAL domain-containing protein (putative c-di-GMP-specific phosphodiesterase class I)
VRPFGVNVSASEVPADLDATRLRLLTAATTGNGLAPEYQPVVSLPDGHVIGYEALARWPQLGDIQPQAVFAHAATVDALDRLDRYCAESAIRGAVESDLPQDSVLLVNSEPTSSFIPDTTDASMSAGLKRFQVIIELTERDLLVRPGALLRRIEALRDRGCGVALDDVGVSPDSLAMLDVVRPDLVKLDIGFVQSALRGDPARTLSGVLDYCQRSGALIVAEGIETTEHYEQALTVGATFGQGFHLGRPAAIHPAVTALPGRNLPAVHRPILAAASSVFDHISAQVPAFTARRTTAEALSRDLTRKAAEGTYQPIVLAAVVGAERFSAEMSQRYSALAVGSPLVAIFATDLSVNLGGGVRGVTISPHDPLATEWLTLILDCDVAAALAVRRRPDRAEDTETAPRYDVTITRDRSLVADAARGILSRMP